uniref:Uncharacterized protein n=1 Tax=Arion vulgaris TaxID=1028688 RepID=A0A0B6Z1H6_9EUPU
MLALTLLPNIWRIKTSISSLKSDLASCDFPSPCLKLDMWISPFWLISGRSEKGGGDVKRQVSACLQGMVDTLGKVHLTQRYP